MWKLNYATGITVFLSVVLLLDKGRCHAQQIDQYLFVPQQQQNGLLDILGRPGSNLGSGDPADNQDVPGSMTQQNGPSDNQRGPGSMTKQNVPSDNQRGPDSNTGRGGAMPGWMEMAQQFMSSWINSNSARSQAAANNGTTQSGTTQPGTTQSGGFFESLMDGIAAFTSDMRARAQNSTSSVSPRLQRIQNRTSNWFNNWRNNMAGFFF